MTLMMLLLRYKDGKATANLLDGRVRFKELDMEVADAEVENKPLDDPDYDKYKDVDCKWKLTCWTC